MGDRAKIQINKYTALELLKYENLDLDKFYTTDLRILAQVAKNEVIKLEKQNKKHKQCLNKINQYLLTNRLYDVEENCVNEILLEMIDKVGE